MASPVKPIPEGYHTATPYLVVNGAARALWSDRGNEPAGLSTILQGRLTQPYRAVASIAYFTGIR